MLGFSNNQAVACVTSHNNEIMASPVINDQSMNTAVFWRRLLLSRVSG